MKTRSILAVLLLMVAGLQAIWAQKMVVTMADDSKVVYDILQVKDITFEEAEEPEEQYEWVDLGLPSGTLWATCNVGASSPEEYGDYFAWGETKPKTTYNWDTYFDTEDGGITFKKYNNNGGLTELLPEDDAATANWGSGWRMPSLDQIKELYNSSYTKTEWTQVNGVNGRKITSISNGNSIFLPAAGSRWDDELYHAGSRGYSWSSSLDPSFDYYADFVYFSSSRWYWRNDWARGYGHSVRAVRP